MKISKINTMNSSVANKGKQWIPQHVTLFVLKSPPSYSTNVTGVKCFSCVELINNNKEINMWTRDQYTGPGGGAYTGPDGGLYTGPGGGAYTGPGGGMYTGPDGGMYTGPGGGLYTGPGGGLYTGPGGGLYTGPGGGLYTGPGGGLYTGPDGGMYTGPSTNPYMSNIPPWKVFVEYLSNNGFQSEADLIMQHLR